MQTCTLPLMPGGNFSACLLDLIAFTGRPSLQYSRRIKGTRKIGCVCPFHTDKIATSFLFCFTCTSWSNMHFQMQSLCCSSFCHQVRSVMLEVLGCWVFFMNCGKTVQCLYTCRSTFQADKLHSAWKLVKQVIKTCSTPDCFCSPLQKPAALCPSHFGESHS